MENNSEPIIGYEMSLSYNNTIMYGPEEQTPPVCPNCGLALSYFQHRPNYSTKQRLPGLPRRNYDIAVTFDHRIIVSQAFRDFCLQSEYDGLEFLDFVDDPLHFQLKLTKDLRLDRERSQIKFGKLCAVCQRYDAIAGGREPWTEWGSKQGSMVYEISEPIADVFFRSDLSLGPENKRSPRIIVGIETREKLKAAGLTGVSLRPAYGIDPGSEPFNPQEQKSKKSHNSKGPISVPSIVTPVLRSKRRRKAS